MSKPSGQDGGNATARNFFRHPEPIHCGKGANLLPWDRFESPLISLVSAEFTENGAPLPIPEGQISFANVGQGRGRSHRFCPYTFVVILTAGSNYLAGIVRPMQDHFSI